MKGPWRNAQSHIVDVNLYESLQKNRNLRLKQDENENGDTQVEDDEGKCADEPGDIDEKVDNNDV